MLSAPGRTCLAAEHCIGHFNVLSKCPQHYHLWRIDPRCHHLQTTAVCCPWCCCWLQFTSCNTIMADPTDEPHQNYLQELKAAAEAQMRRSAPELDDDAGPRSRRQKVADGQDDASDHVEGHVGRYTYAAIDTLARGCTAFLGSCGFRRERSSTKEVLNVLNKVLPQGMKIDYPISVNHAAQVRHC